MEKLVKIIEQVVTEKLISKTRRKALYKLFLRKNFQENYDLYKSVRTKQNYSKVEVAEAHEIGSMLSRRLIAAICNEEHQSNVPKKYNLERSQLGRKRMKTIERPTPAVKHDGRERRNDGN